MDELSFRRLQELFYALCNTIFFLNSQLLIAFANRSFEHPVFGFQNFSFIFGNQVFLCKIIKLAFDWIQIDEFLANLK